MLPFNRKIPPRDGRKGYIRDLLLESGSPEVDSCCTHIGEKEEAVDQEYQKSR